MKKLSHKWKKKLKHAFPFFLSKQRPSVEGAAKIFEKFIPQMEKRIEWCLYFFSSSLSIVFFLWENLWSGRCTVDWIMRLRYRHLNFQKFQMFLQFLSNFGTFSKKNNTKTFFCALWDKIIFGNIMKDLCFFVETPPSIFLLGHAKIFKINLREDDRFFCFLWFNNLIIYQPGQVVMKEIWFFFLLTFYQRRS